MTSSFESGSPGTVAAEQMPKYYSVNGNAVSVEHIMVGIHQKNTNFTATIITNSTLLVALIPQKKYLTYVIHLGFTHMCTSSSFPTLLSGIISQNLSLQYQTVHHKQHSKRQSSIICKHLTHHHSNVR